MIKNIRMTYSRLLVPKIPGVYPYEREFIVYIRGLKSTNKGKICADRKFKIEEGANIYFNGLTSDQRE